MPGRRFSGLPSSRRNGLHASDGKSRAPTLTTERTTTTGAATEFDKEVRRVVEYFRAEFDLTYSEAIGVLDMVKHEILHQSLDDESDDKNEPLARRGL